VTFAQGTYGAVYSSNAPTFFGNSSGATDAVNALAAALASIDPAGGFQNASWHIGDASRTHLRLA
jgi:hypothetical protein